MRIGIDAKRAFFNNSGLGNYSRNTIRHLGRKYPENEYYLYIPRRDSKIPNGGFEKHNLSYPRSWTGRTFSSLWRSYWLGRRLEKDGIDLYHGLSNEIPYDMPRPGIRSVVTIHDLIFIRHPEWYKSIDRKIYIKKAEHACRHADRIIAISEQTSSDIQEYLGVSPEKIDVVYQGCDPAFYTTAGETERISLSVKYSLPSRYMLYVGTIEPRKNLLKIVEAMHRDSIEMSLIAIGRSTPYLDIVKEFVEEHSMHNVTFLQDVPNEDLPGLYQMAEMFIYPSSFEGFGIPILEALASGTPVITSKGGCFAEAGGKYSAYIDPYNLDEFAETIRKIINDKSLREKMSSEGLKDSRQFSEDIIVDNIMKVYKKVL